MAQRAGAAPEQHPPARTDGCPQPPRNSPSREHGGLQRGREVARQEREEKKGLSY